MRCDFDCKDNFENYFDDIETECVRKKMKLIDIRLRNCLR